MPRKQKTSVNTRRQRLKDLNSNQKITPSDKLITLADKHLISDKHIVSSIYAKILSHSKTLNTISSLKNIVNLRRHNSFNLFYYKGFKNKMINQKTLSGIPSFHSETRKLLIDILRKAGYYDNLTNPQSYQRRFALMKHPVEETSLEVCEPLEEFEILNRYSIISKFLSNGFDGLIKSPLDEQIIQEFSSLSVAEQECEFKKLKKAVFDFAG
ncbi:hypothetical protein [Mucilaginibacter pedocola]|uniref:Uncharacterized protein n=1 Tax=Mucilaginibacter pedocola TaxID=1792845 RepID=A0A1S9P8Z6_9SPHI|nr:hypothetical protein [Mucilaginibacter pedocola]OOQ57389.1 hypothetical protein BC343_14915 [Mucilaginibacter pedocola]